MGKKKTPATASEKYRTELAEIEQPAQPLEAQRKGCQAQLNLLDQAQDDMDGRGLTVIKTTPRGAEIEVANPSIQVYNQTASAANSTVSTLLRVVQTFKFMAAKPSEDDEL